MTLSIHDNLIVSYEVLCGKRTIVLRTEFSDVDPPELAEVVFDDFEAYHLTDDAFGNIILDIEEMSAKELIDDYRAEIVESMRYGILAKWGREIDTVQSKLRVAGVRGFILSASMGLSGS